MTIKRAFERVYGIEGFDVYPAFERDKAIKEYEELLKVAKI
ncbi:MAG: hypothetical protein QMD44_13140 [Thermodesulfovibrionales bacterium]|nr:hypothetical protein [Thermodesulfovibrionales bacterium]